MHNLRGHSIAVSPFSKLILRENQNLFQKGSLKRSNYQDSRSGSDNVRYRSDSAGDKSHLDK
jgi:hypothetical protein